MSNINDKVQSQLLQEFDLKGAADRAVQKAGALWSQAKGIGSQAKATVGPKVTNYTNQVKDVTSASPQEHTGAIKLIGKDVKSYASQHLQKLANFAQSARG